MAIEHWQVMAFGFVTFARDHHCLEFKGFDVLEWAAGNWLYSK